MFVAISCNKESTPPEDQFEAGDLIAEKMINTWDTLSIQILVHAMNSETPRPLKYDVTVYSLTYYTRNAFGDLVPATGALFVPEHSGNMPLLSIQHGTESKRSQVASENPLYAGEGIVGLVTGSLGYITCIPDYLGLGGSAGLHPYLHAATLSANVIDFLVAASKSLEEKSVNTTGELYLTGYSEGGYVTMATHKALQEDLSSPFTVTASVPMAGPYDLKGTIDTILSHPEYPNPAFIAYFLLAYNQVYQWNRLGDIFMSPYETMVPQLFDGNHTTSQISEALPATLSELIQNDFVSGYLSGTDQQLMSAVEENTLLDWVPQAPVLLIQGVNDEIVPPQNMMTAKDYFENHGATGVETWWINGGTHSEAAVPAYVRMISWVDSLHQAGYSNQK